MHSTVYYRKGIQNFAVLYLSKCLTIRLRARDFYEVIVDEGEARIKGESWNIQEIDFYVKL